MKIPGLSERVIAEHAEKGSIDRGREYFRDGAVKSLKRMSDSEVEAFVQGTDIAPYQVDVRHDANGIKEAVCSCPYVTGSWCRHIVAALYAIMESEGSLSRPMEEMLGDFDRSELGRLVERIVAEHPEASSTVEAFYRQKQVD